jgi:hypothetical protein
MLYMQQASTVPNTTLTIPGYSGSSEPIHAISFASSGSTSSSSFYLNGSLLATSTYPQVTANTAGPFNIGAATAYGGFQGEMGELIIFNSVLNSAQVSQIYKSQLLNTSGVSISFTNR